MSRPKQRPLPRFNGAGQTGLSHLPPNVRRLGAQVHRARRMRESIAPISTPDETTPTPSPVAVAIARDGVEPAELHVTSATVFGRIGSLLVMACFASIAIFLARQSMPLQAMSLLRPYLALGSPTQTPLFTNMRSWLDRSAEPSEPEPSEPEPRLRRDGHVSIPGGILVLPDSFQPKDGQYDLLIHFHGNTAVVRESAEVAGLDAAVAIINLGIGSLPYEESYAVPGTYEELLGLVNRGLKERGLKDAHLRRVALSGWSAGYGAISTILQVRRKQERLDAVLVFDGIHCGFEGGGLNPRQLKPFVDVATRAQRGELLFGMTHSAIDPIAYASTTMTADYLLAKLGAPREKRDAAKDAPEYVHLDAMEGAVSKSLERTMEPTGEARTGNVHVIGYRGETKEHHMAHLFQMSKTLLPELVARWSKN